MFFPIDKTDQIEIIGSPHLTKENTENFTCSSSESNPAASISWFVSWDGQVERLEEAKIESTTQQSGSGWTTVSRAAVTDSYSPSFTIFCTSQIDSLGYKADSQHLNVEVHSKKDTD